MATNKTFDEHPRRWAISEPDRPAIIYPSLGATITYGELDRCANRVAHNFRKLGMNRGGHVAILVENTPVFHALAWAAHNAGLHYTAISWRFRVEEIEFIIQNCGAWAVYFTPQQNTIVSELKMRLPSVAFVAMDPGDNDPSGFEHLFSDAPDTPISDESRGSDMLYSSGSTGKPKGVLQSLPSQGVDGLSAMFSIYKDRYGWNGDTVYLMPAPLYHSGPLRFAMAMQHIGAKLVVMQKFDAETALALVEQYKVTDAQLVPTMLIRLLKLSDKIKRRYDLSSLKTIVHGAAPIAPEAKRAAIDCFGPILEESYGGTEGNGMTMISSNEWLNHVGSVGKPFLGAVHIHDDDGNELGPRETGVIYFSGGPDFSYHKDPERTKKAYDARGRSTLGDVGYVDEEGYLYLTDRKDFMAICGGVNVFPQEAENRLITHPEVADACVFGVPDAEMGEVLHAEVELLAPDSACDNIEQRLIAWCREAIASIKCPRSVSINKKLPRHDTGKIYKKVLKEQWLANHDMKCGGPSN